MNEEKWTVVAEHFDEDPKSHYSLNWTIDNRYFTKLCGISDGLSLNKETMLLVLKRVITNYNIVTILELDNSHNQSQAEINKFKKFLNSNAAARGYPNTKHCDGEPSDLLLSKDHLQLYESLDLKQSLDKSIDKRKRDRDELESEIEYKKKLIDGLERTIKKQVNTIRLNEYTISLYDKRDDSRLRSEYMELKARFDELKKRYRKGLDICKELEQKAETIKKEADLYATKKMEEADLYVTKKKQYIDSLDQKFLKYQQNKRIDKLLKENNIDYDILRKMIYDRNLYIAKTNF